MNYNVKEQTKWRFKDINKLAIYGALLTSVVGLTFGDLYTKSLTGMAFIACFIYFVSEEIEEYEQQ